MAFLLEPHDNVRQKSSIGAVIVAAQRWVNTRCFHLPWTGMSGELRPRQLPEWRERFERCARAGRGCVRRVWWGEATVSKRFSGASAIGWTVHVKCRFTPRPPVHGLPGGLNLTKDAILSASRRRTGPQSESSICIIT